MKDVYKVYNDGGAFIGIRKVESSSAHRRKPAPEELVVIDEGVELMHDEDYENTIDPVLCGNEAQKIKILQADGGYALEKAQKICNRHDAPVFRQ